MGATYTEQMYQNEPSATECNPAPVGHTRQQITRATEQALQPRARGPHPEQLGNFCHIIAATPRPWATRYKPTHAGCQSRPHNLDHHDARGLLVDVSEVAMACSVPDGRARRAAACACLR